MSRPLIRIVKMPSATVTALGYLGLEAALLVTKPQHIHVASMVLVSLSQLLTVPFALQFLKRATAGGRIFWRLMILTITTQILATLLQSGVSPYGTSKASAIHVFSTLLYAFFPIPLLIASSTKFQNSSQTNIRKIYIACAVAIAVTFILLVNSIILNDRPGNIEVSLDLLFLGVRCFLVVAFGIRLLAAEGYEERYFFMMGCAVLTLGTSIAYLHDYLALVWSSPAMDILIAMPYLVAMLLFEAVPDVPTWVAVPSRELRLFSKALYPLFVAICLYLLSFILLQKNTLEGEWALALSICLSACLEILNRQDRTSVDEATAATEMLLKDLQGRSSLPTGKARRILLSQLQAACFRAHVLQQPVSLALLRLQSYERNVEDYGALRIEHELSELQVRLRPLLAADSDSVYYAGSGMFCVLLEDTSYADSLRSLAALTDAVAEHRSRRQFQMRAHMSFTTAVVTSNPTEGCQPNELLAMVKARLEHQDWSAA